MPNILDKIVAHKRIALEQAKSQCPLDELKKRIADLPPTRNFFNAVTKPSNHINVIAEIKRASPSAGLIRQDFDPAAIAKAYHTNSAAAISCLTEEKYFQGSLDYLTQIHHAVPLPLLRKDFIIDEYQLYEARAAHADAVLLIAECLTDTQLTSLIQHAVSINLTVLLEIHDEQNLPRALHHINSNPDSCLLGINNRNLQTMTTDLNHTLQLIDKIPNPSIIVSESGIKTHADIKTLLAADIRAILVGEHLMRQPDEGKALHKLIHGN